MASETITSFEVLKCNFEHGNKSDLRVSIYTTFPKHDGNEYSTHYTLRLILDTITLVSEVHLKIKVDDGVTNLEAFLADYTNTSTGTQQQGFLFRLNEDDIGWYQTYNSINPALSTYENSIDSLFAKHGQTLSGAGHHIYQFLTGIEEPPPIGGIEHKPPARDNSSKRPPLGGKKCTTKSRRTKSRRTKSRRNKSRCTKSRCTKSRCTKSRR
jgi:hypothetical protein